VGVENGNQRVIGITPAGPVHSQKIVDYYENMGYRVIID
jgi:hypothetical protein